MNEVYSSGCPNRVSKQVFLLKEHTKMSHARIQSQFKTASLTDETGEILLQEALKYYRQAKQYYENPDCNEARAKFLIRKSLLFFKAAENMGNIKAKEWFLEAKIYYNTKSPIDDEYVIVSSPDTKNEQDLIIRSEKNSEFISAGLYKNCKINLISNWVKKAPICRIEIPTEINTPVIQLN